MPANHLLTGPPRSGKTTAIQRTIDRLDRSVGGVSSPEVREGGQRVGFATEALDTGESGVLGRIKARDDAIVYRVTSDSRDALPVRLANKLQ